MRRHDEAVLDLMDSAASEYFATAVLDGSYRGFLTLDGTTNALAAAL